MNKVIVALCANAFASGSAPAPTDDDWYWGICHGREWRVDGCE
jgi:hypothetical protein